MTPDAFEAAMRRLMTEVTTLTLATCRGEVPWASDVYFAADGFDLFFFSSPRSRHCTNLAANAKCAATVHPTVSSWHEIRGLQMEGEARPLDTPEAQARALAAYVQKFPFVRSLMASPSDAAAPFGRAIAHVFCPSRILHLDNAFGVGTRFEVLLVRGRPVGPPVRESRESSLAQ